MHNAAQTTGYDPRIARAFDAAMTAAKIDQETLTLVGRTVSIRINGKLYSHTIAASRAVSVESMRYAIAECLAEHCTLESVRMVRVGS